jgi:hypothetical protein
MPVMGREGERPCLVPTRGGRSRPSAGSRGSVSRLCGRSVRATRQHARRCASPPCARCRGDVAQRRPGPVGFPDRSVPLAPRYIRVVDRVAHQLQEVHLLRIGRGVRHGERLQSVPLRTSSIMSRASSAHVSRSCASSCSLGCAVGDLAGKAHRAATGEADDATPAQLVTTRRRCELGDPQRASWTAAGSAPADVSPLAVDGGGPSQPVAGRRAPIAGGGTAGHQAMRECPGLVRAQPAAGWGPRTSRPGSSPVKASSATVCTPATKVAW